MSRYKEEIELVDELNEQIADNKYLENLGMTFSLTTNGYCQVIEFGNFVLYNSEADSLVKFDDESNKYIDMPLKEFIINSFNRLKEELYNISLTEIK